MNLRAKFRQWQLYRETINELRRCSNRQLDDLGIVRADIRTVASRSSQAAF